MVSVALEVRRWPVRYNAADAHVLLYLNIPHITVHRGVEALIRKSFKRLAPPCVLARWFETNFLFYGYWVVASSVKESISNNYTVAQPARESVLVSLKMRLSA